MVVLHYVHEHVNLTYTLKRKNFNFLKNIIFKNGCRIYKLILKNVTYIYRSFKY